MKQLPNLTPLRFFLAVIVMLFHIPQLCHNQGLPYYDQLPIFHKGVEAVYLFFSLSGYLIIRKIYLQRQAGIFSIRTFLTRRARRILPLYYLVAIFGLCFYHIVLPFLQIPFDNHYNLWKGVLLLLLFMPNILLQCEPGGILEILWSIGIEEQFYILIAPLLFFVDPKRMLIALLFVCIGYFICFHITAFEFLSTFKMVFFYMLAGGIFGIFAESAASYKMKWLRTHSAVPILISALTLCVFFSDVLSDSSDIIYNLVLTVLFPFFLFTISEHQKIAAITSKLLNHLGNISYGIYMYHVIVLNAVVFVFDKLEDTVYFSDTSTIILINTITLLITVMISHLSYKYFELYFLRGGRPSRIAKT